MPTVDPSLSGKIALLTGGSNEIGRAIALSLAVPTDVGDESAL